MATRTNVSAVGAGVGNGSLPVQAINVALHWQGPFGLLFRCLCLIGRCQDPDLQAGLKNRYRVAGLGVANRGIRGGLALKRGTPVALVGCQIAGR